ncbi:GRB2-associated-binding protein 1-like [Centruroides sculpturatus]|uniref:GRB2-associated-binding protein 1-like n=1 Tax=Centruroides sculpturatus TaxID=218467 RepID=UPI000C6D528A|nr:GRB2-associated-binding protein 1-like [Centruroides sculpturatus]
MEIVHDGWLVKSPPEKRILKAKWRQRWFVLRHSGQLPGQFVLEYYTDDSRKKLKGKIDLDQCEQVDAGLSFESRKSNYQYMFDIRTPKRVYYLVAETESSMNKWVDCICSVCGLKIHLDDDYMPPQTTTSSQTVSTNSVTPAQSTSNLELSRSGSNPYIPISECISGKPITNGFNCESCNESLPEAPPPPPPPKMNSEERRESSEFYDYPKPLNFINDRNRTSPELNVEEFYKIPQSLKNTEKSFIQTDSFVYNLPPLPPKVNWDTYPQDSYQKKNKSDLDFDTCSRSTTPEDNIHEKFTSEVTSQLEQINLNSNNNGNLQAVISQDSNDVSENVDQVCINKDTLDKPPPRPPKPQHLGRKYENVTINSLSENNNPVYDTPLSAKGVQLSKNLPAQVFAFLKDDTDLESISPSTKVPVAFPKSKDVALDDIYDFPKFRSEDNINMPVPPPINAKGSQRRRRHAYTNAPPGLFNNKETIFNYEFVKPSLCSDGYLSMDSQKSEIYTDMSGELQLSPSAMGTYANIPTSPSASLGSVGDIPPAVNRELKPKRKVSDAENQNGILTLAPPPVSRFRPHVTKRSFRKPRLASSSSSFSERIGTTPPPIPGRGHRRSEHSTSDDDLASSGGSRRNSTNSEQEVKQMIPPAPQLKKEEIQYLDLDLDSDASVQSPRSPEKSSSASIVYKKIDFVKTKVFNEMRQNVEENYRKSQ